MVGPGRRMLIACWIPKATNIRSEYVILITFPRQQGYTNAPQCYGIRSMPVLGELVLGRCVGSNLGYPNRDSSWFDQVPPGKCHRITSIR